jgi:hypothetical protein
MVPACSRDHERRAEPDEPPVSLELAGETGIVDRERLQAGLGQAPLELVPAAVGTRPVAGHVELALACFELEQLRDIAGPGCVSEQSGRR